MAAPTQIGLSVFPSDASLAAPGRFFALLVAAGLLNSLLVALLFLHLPAAHEPTLTSLIVRAVAFVVIGALAGAAGSWFYWRRPASPFRENPPVPFLLFALASASGWVWVPAVVLLSRDDSPLTPAVAAIAAALLAASLRQIIAGPPGQPTRVAAIPPQLFAETLRTPPRHFYGYVLALCIYASAFELQSAWILNASALLAPSAFFCAWKMTLEPSGSSNAASRQQTARAARRLAILMLPAILVTLFTLLSGIGHRNRAEAAAIAAAHANPGVDESRSSNQSTAAALSGYHSIILWPPVTKKEVLASLPAQTSLLAPGTTKPLIIQFDGPYWYFQPPNQRPSSSAQQAHGTPLGINIQSNNFIPLVMEAHQTLGVPIPIARCREIQLAILNGDASRGTLHIALLLTDSTAPHHQLYLGRQPVLSRQSASFAAAPGPATETLRFPIPNPATLRKFNEITVMFLPDDANYDKGSRVAIRQFQLIPR